VVHKTVRRGPYQPKTGAKCGCRRGVQRDNCPACEGTGWVIDFAAIRRRNQTAIQARNHALETAIQAMNQVIQ